MKKTRPKPYKIQKGRSRGRYRKAESVEGIERPKLYDSATVQVCRNIQKKKGREEERQRNVFLCTADLKLWRKGQMHTSRGDDELASRK